MEDQVVSINFSQGLDTKTTDKLVMPGKMTVLRDAIFSAVPPSGKQLNKRNGYDSMSRVIENSAGTIVNPKGTWSYKNELVLAAANSLNPTQGRLFSYSTTASAWVDKGKYQPVKITDQVISNDNIQVSSSASISGSYILTAWSSLSGSNLYFNILDTSTNTFITPETSLSPNKTDGTGVWVVKLASGIFGILYCVNATSHLTLIIVTVSGSSVTVGAPITLATDNVVSSLPIGFAAMEIASGGASITFPTATPLMKIITINSSGTITQTGSTARPAGTIRNVTMTTDSAGQFWVYINTGGTNKLEYAIFSSTLTVVLVMTDTLITASAPYRIFALSNSTSSQTLFYVHLDPTFGSYPIIKKFNVDNIGTIGSVSDQITNAELYAAPFTFQGNTYLPIFFDSTTLTQDAYYLLDLFDNKVIAKSLPGKASGFIFNTSGYIIPISSTRVGLLAGFFPPTASGTKALSGQSTALVTFDFGSLDIHQGFNTGQALVMNGGIVKEYDGQPNVELGFSIFPDQVTTGISVSPGNLTNGAYQYFVTYRWFDNNGNVYESAPSVGAFITVGAGPSAVDLRITTTSLTEKIGPSRFPIQIVIYRTLANQTIAHQITSDEQPLLNDPSVVAVTYTDTQDDSLIESNAVIYTTGGILENIAPPASTIMVLRTNRLYLVDDENPNTLWPSKSFEPGVGISFSDLLTEQVDERGGPITALGALDDKLIMFKAGTPFFSNGDPGNDAGQGSTFSVPQLVLSDVGCIQSKSLVSMPSGIIRKTDKGLYLLDRSLNDQYIGFDVEQFNSQSVTSALIVYGKNQVRFLTDSGYSLLFDYFYNQWSSFSNHEGSGATLWNGVYVYVRTDGKIFKENTISFLDDTTAYAWYGQTAWMKTSQIQGFQRFKKALFAGSYANGSSASHGMQVQIAYDYVPSFSSAVPLYFSQSASTSGLVQYRQFPQKQKCEAFQLLIQELPTGVSGENLALTDLALEVMIKKGPFKLPAVRSVG